MEHLKDVIGIEYVDIEKILKQRKADRISISDLVANFPPKDGVPSRVRIIKWKPDGNIRYSYTYLLNKGNGANQNISLYPMKSKRADVNLGDTVFYLSEPD